MSLEYAMFRFSDGYPTAEGLSEMIMQVCMDDDRGDSEHAERLLRALINAAYELRYQEALEKADEDEADIPYQEALEKADEDEADIPSVREPGYLFMDKYEAACKKIGEPCNEGDAWWEDWWPTDCPWHPDDIALLARLKAGETRSIRRQLREEFAKHKEKSDA